MKVDTATIFDIQRFSIHDGPGIRTTVFFKGCTMNCQWCQNPESIRFGKEMAVYLDRCIGCGLCAENCPKEAISAGSPSRIDRRLCDCCGICAQKCPADALVLVGRDITANDLLTECLADRSFYNRSGGGVTLSGGEPVLQSAFLLGFLPLLRRESINVVMETAGHYAFSKLEPLLPMLDCIYYDIKMPTPEEYRTMTGGDMVLILENLIALKKREIPLNVRIPVLPGLNTAPGQIARIGRTLRAIGIRDLQLLAYNPFWESKLFRLQTDKRPLMLSDKDIDYRHIADEFAKTGITPDLPVPHGTRNAG
jgi:pyruvate formate lyase activating enzyme